MYIISLKVKLIAAAVLGETGYKQLVRMPENKPLMDVH